MKFLKKKTVKEEVIDRLQCDKCKMILKEDGFNNKIHLIQVEGFYGSEFPEDGNTFEVELCGMCLEDLLGKYGRVVKTEE